MHHNGGPPQADESGEVSVEARGKQMKIKPLPMGTSEMREKDRPATPNELTAYRSAVGTLLFVGRIACPVAAFQASHRGTKCGDLHLRHMRMFNTMIKRLKGDPARVSYLPANNGKFRLEAHSDASMNCEDNMTRVGEGIVVLRRNKSVVFFTGWVSKLARRVARSTSTTELISAAYAVDKIT